MPIATRQPVTDGPAALALPPVQRRGSDPSIGSSSAPPEGLLPSGGRHAPVPAPASARALAPDAVRLLRWSADPTRRPDAWSDPAFERQVEMIRGHLAPVRSRRALAASFAREAFHHAGSANGWDRHAERAAFSVRLAYAIRWAELAPRAGRGGG